MKNHHSFKFLDSALNHELIMLLKRAKIEHRVDSDGTIHYSKDDEDTVDNDLICSIRDKVFASWQVLTCPRDWGARYKEYMKQHAVPFLEERSNGELWFLIPRKYRPHSWRLDEPGEKKGRLAPQWQGR